MRLKSTRAASRDLESVEQYISRNNPNAAIDTVLEIIRRVEMLAEHPGMGRPGRVEGTRELALPPYVVPYVDQGDAVHCSSSSSRRNEMARTFVRGFRPEGRADGGWPYWSVIGRAAIGVAEDADGPGSGRCGFANQCLESRFRAKLAPTGGDPGSRGAVNAGLKLRCLAGAKMPQRKTQHGSRTGAFLCPQVRVRKCRWAEHQRGAGSRFASGDRQYSACLNRHQRRLLPGE